MVQFAAKLYSVKTNNLIKCAFIEKLLAVKISYKVSMFNNQFIY